MDEIHALAKKHNLIVIEDGTHALGAEYKGQKIGGLSDMTTFSFHPVKHITTGEGGMILTNNEELYKHIISLPLYPDLTEEERDYVIEKVIEAVRKSNITNICI